MKIYIYFIIVILISSCASNNEVYWCGDHACTNNKEKEAYFKKTMIVEVKNLDKKNTESLSVNQKILNQSKTEEKSTITSVEDSVNEIKLEKEIERNEEEIEKQIELQIQEIAKKEEKLNEQIELIQDEKISKKEDTSISSSFDKVAEINEINEKDFDELVEKILIRNSSRSYPEINDISK